MRHTNVRGVQVLARKGERQENVIYEGENKHVTLVGCVNAAGRSITPMLIFSGVRPLSSLFSGWLECIPKMSEKGFITNEIWYDWVHHFIKETGGNCTLVCDWHSSRADLGAIQALRAANVKLIVLQPHTTHVCQPCDVSVFRSFKGHLRTLVKDRRVRGDKTDLHDIAGLCKVAWAKTMEIKTDPATGIKSSPAIHGFEKTGIWPYNPAKITKDMTKIADDLLERARKLRAEEEAKEEKEDAGIVPRDPKRKREADEDEDEDGIEELQGEARVQAIEAELVVPVPIEVRLERHLQRERKVRKATILTSEEYIQAELDVKEAKAEAQRALEERKAIRAANAAAKAKAAKARRRRDKKHQGPLLALLAPAPSSSSTSSSSSSSPSAAAAAAAIFTPSPAAGARSAASAPNSSGASPVADVSEMTL